MRMDDRLNLVIPVPRDGGRNIYIHAAPVSRETFEEHFLLIGKTYSAIMAEGLSIISGPRLAHLLLKRLAILAGNWAGPEGVERTLVAEIVRLANVAVPGESGWQLLPLMTALTQGLVSADEKSEVMGALVFFTVSSAMQKKDILEEFMMRAGDLWGTQVTFLDCMAYVDSLATSTGTANTGDKKPEPEKASPPSGADATVPY